MNRDQQRLEVPRQRVSKLLTIGDAIGHVDPEAVRAAAAAKLTPTSERFAVMLANLVLANVEGLALILAGQASDEAMSALLAALEPGSIDLFDAWLLGSLTMSQSQDRQGPRPKPTARPRAGCRGRRVGGR